MEPRAQELPQEIWIEICRWLSAADLLQLRLSCRILCAKVSTRATWRPRCYDNWLRYQAHDVWNAETLPQGKSWFQYFCYRQALDRRMLGDITTYRPEYHQFFPDFGQRYSAGHAVTLLRRVVQQGFVHSALSFDAVTLCRRLLTSLRHKYVYELFAPSDAEYVHDAEQTVFLRLAAMDGSFDLLLPHRQRVLQRVHSLVRQEHGGGEFLEMPATLRVDRIVYHLMGLLAPPVPVPAPAQARALEDFMLLRVYAGETPGHPLLILAIVQALASHYGVETVLCGSYLVIRDPQLHAGETYLTVSVRGVPKIFTRRRLVQSLRRILGGSTEHAIATQILPSILQPLPRRELVCTVFRELLPLHARSKWSSASPRNRDTLHRLFPHSRQPMSAEIVHYFSCVYKAAEIQSRIETRISSLYAVAFKEVFRLVSRVHPGDYCYAAKLLHSKGVDFGEHLLGYEEWLFQLHSIALERSDQLGTFVTSAREEQPLCVVGARTFQNGNTYYTLMNFCGEFFVELSDNLRAYNARSHAEEIAEFLECAGMSDLGLVFSHLDRGSGRLVPNERVERMLRERGEQSGL